MYNTAIVCAQRETCFYSRPSFNFTFKDMYSAHEKQVHNAARTAVSQATTKLTFTTVLLCLYTRKMCGSKRSHGRENRQPFRSILERKQNSRNSSIEYRQINLYHKLQNVAEKL